MYQAHDLAWRLITNDLQHPETNNHRCIVEMMGRLDQRYQGLGTPAMAGPPYTPLSHWLSNPVVDETGATRWTEAIGCFYTDVARSADVPRRVIFLSRTGADANGGWTGLRIEMLGICRLMHPNLAEWIASGRQWVEDFRTATLRVAYNGDPAGGTLANGVTVTASRPLHVNSAFPHLQTFFDQSGAWMLLNNQSNNHNDAVYAQQIGDDIYLTMTLGD